MERDKIEAVQDQLLQLQTLYLAINSASANGCVSFIRHADGLYVYMSNLSPHVRDLIDQREATCMLWMKVTARIYGRGID